MVFSFIVDISVSRVRLTKYELGTDKEDEEEDKSEDISGLYTETIREIIY
jgi:hypothetical protein